MALLYGFAARCLFGVVFLHKAKQGGWLCADSTHKSLPHQRTAHRFTMKAPRPGQSLISSPCHGYCDVFFAGNFFQSFWFWAIWHALRNLDDDLLRCEREHFQKDCRKKCTWQSQKVLWVIVACASHSPFSPSFQTFPFDRSNAGSQPRQTYGLFAVYSSPQWCSFYPKGQNQPWAIANLYVLNLKDHPTQFRFLGNCPPTHPLSQQFALSGK